MKKILFIALSLILSLTATSLYARGMGKGMGYGGCGDPGPGFGMHKPFMHLDMLQYRFDLTNEQVEKVYKIDKEYMDKFYQNRKDPDKIRDLREKHRAEIESILTAEQKKKWNEFKDNRPVKNRDWKDGRCPGFGPMNGMHGPMGMMQKDLALTEEQFDKIHKIHRDYMDRFFQNRNDGDKVRDLRKKQDAEIESVLSKEQKEKWSQLRNNHPGWNKKSGDKNRRHMMWDYDYDDK